MSGPHEKLARLRRYNLAVQQKDPKLAEESRFNAWCNCHVRILPKELDHVHSVRTPLP